MADESTSWAPAWPSPLPPPLLPGGTPLYLSGEDGLRMLVLNSAAGVTIRCAGRFLPLGGTRVLPFNFDLTPPSDRSSSSRTQPLGEGWLLDAAAFVSSGTPQRGQTWAALSINRGGPLAGIELTQLAYGYVTARQYVAYGLRNIEGPLDGPGALRSITGTTPAAGVNISETVPTGARWELVSFRFTLVTNATVATRVVSGVIDDGANILTALSAQGTQTASLTISYTIGQELASGFSNSDNNYAIQVPSDFRLAAAYRVRTTCANIQAGDQFSAPQYLVREWIAGE